MDRGLVLTYFPEETSDLGVPLILIRYEHQAESAPYLNCTALTSYLDSDLALPARYVEYVEALLCDLNDASSNSRKTALLMLDRLEAISFGPIRVHSVS